MEIRSRNASIVLVSLLLSGTACTSYKQIEITEVGAYDEIQVIQKSGSKGTLLHPSVELDSLRGHPRDYPTPVSIPLDQVDEVQAKVAAPGKTAGLVAGTAVFVGLAVLLGAAIAFASSF